MSLDSIHIEFLKRNLPEFKRKIAESQSRYSETISEKQIHRKIYDAKQALIWIFIATFYNWWNTDKIIKQIGYLAYRYQYQGKWKEVQEILEQFPQNPLDFIDLYLNNHSPQDLFGNFLPKAEKELLLISYQSESSIAHKRGRIKYPRSRREYCDKGSLRLPSDFHGEPPKKSKEDRRDLISHPLLIKRDNVGENMGQDHVFQERSII